MSGTNILRKLSPETVIGKDNLKRPTNAQEWLYRIVGQVTGVENGTTNFGEYTALLGEFQAMRFSDGELFVSGVAFLPAGMGEYIASRVKYNTNKETGEVNPIQVVLDIGVKPSKRENANFDYEYIVRSPADDAAKSPLRQLLMAYDKPQLPPGALFDKTA